jgi:hypothetical protein
MKSESIVGMLGNIITGLENFIIICPLFDTDSMEAESGNFSLAA